MIGTIVGSYQIVERLGAGGMGEVYRAQHLHLDRQAAIKIVLGELSRDREAVERFFAEARATSLIRHPGIVEVLDCNVHDNGRVYLVMELLEGETLAQRLRRDPEMGRDLPWVLTIADQIADALGAVHRRGIVHRDLKPENVFLVRPGGADGEGGAPRVKVLDFGIAKLVGPGATWASPPEVVTHADRVLGTPAYMAPEQCRDARLVDQRTDIYALGCVLFEMLAGHAPFEGASFGQVVAAQLWEAPPVLPTDPADGAERTVTLPVARLVGRMLAKDPASRPATMESVRREIAAVLERTPPAGAVRAEVRRGWRAYWSGWIAPHSKRGVRTVEGWIRGIGARRFLLGLGVVGWLAVASIIAHVALRDGDDSGPEPAGAGQAPAGARAMGPAAALASPSGPSPGPQRARDPGIGGAADVEVDAPAQVDAPAHAIAPPQVSAPARVDAEARADAEAQAHAPAPPVDAEAPVDGEAQADASRAAVIGAERPARSREAGERRHPAGPTRRVARPAESVELTEEQRKL